jgi:DNA-binding MarR family transcriptional regulator
MDDATGGPERRTAFLLSQLGSLASKRFAERTRAVGLTPADAGLLRLLGRFPGLSQRALADRMNAVPSRMVQLIDSLEERDLVERTRSSSDRRNYELNLTGQGRAVLWELRGIAEQHEAELLASLSPAETDTLHGLLAKLAAAHGADTELHRES